MKSKLAITFLGMCVLIIGTVALIRFLETRPSHLFRKFVAEPIPHGVVLQNSESRLSHAVVYLQFSIPEDSIEQIVKNHDLKKEEYKSPIQEPTWFKPNETDEYWRGDGGTKEMWFANGTAFFKQVNP
jgi:hypothetical protein